MYSIWIVFVSIWKNAVNVFYQEPICKRRDHNIGSCNSCQPISSCKLDKYFYYANKSNEQYLYSLVDSRTGVNLDYPELNQIATIIKSLLDKGQSIFIKYLKNIEKFLNVQKHFIYLHRNGTFLKIWNWLLFHEKKSFSTNQIKEIKKETSTY